MTDADGKCSETMVWLDFFKDYKYIGEESMKNYEEVGEMPGKMIRNPRKFIPVKKKG